MKVYLEFSPHDEALNLCTQKYVERVVCQYPLPKGWICARELYNTGSYAVVVPEHDPENDYASIYIAIERRSKKTAWICSAGNDFAVNMGSYNETTLTRFFALVRIHPDLAPFRALAHGKPIGAGATL